MYSQILMNVQITSTPTGYVAGSLIAIFILAYLLYSLVKPEKF